jgi:hypothetical protein
VTYSFASSPAQAFDDEHGSAWHCVVGHSYGSYVSHTIASSIYFSIGKLAVLLFRTALPPPPPPLQHLQLNHEPRRQFPLPHPSPPS